MVLIGLAIWTIVLLLPWRPWSAAERLEPDRGPHGHSDLSDVVVLIPARDEVATLPFSLNALGKQGRNLKIVVVDDHSRDGTAAIARGTSGASTSQIVLVPGQPLPPDWTGKGWALEQGRQHLDRPLTLLMDADIVLAPGLLSTLRAKLRCSGGVSMASLMATFPTTRFADALLMPPFVYFFKLLYPFARSNRTGSRVAAAAGGCILLRTHLIEEIGGFAALQGTLIDDCTLARLVKNRDHRTWIGLSRSVRSVRSNQGLAGIWDMVARTAYCQLRYSVSALLLCTALMLCAFVAPVVGLFAGPAWVHGAAALSLAAMFMSYLPTLRFYALSPVWVFTLPLAGALYLAMTWTSAVRHWRGRGASWKGRVYGS